MSIQKKEDNKVKLSKEFDLSKEFSVPDYEKWKSSAEKLLKGQSFEKKLISKTYEGIALEPIYLKKNIENLSISDSNPGEGNYLRGTRVDGYLNKSWDICQEITSDSFAELNGELKNAIENGQTAIFLDLEQFGIKNQKIFSEILSGIDINEIPIHIKTRVSLNKALEFLLEHAKANNFDLKKIKGVIEGDFIACLARFGELSDSLDNNYKHIENSLKASTKELPNFKIITVNGQFFHNAGADSVTELAISLATGVEYMSEMITRGFKIDEVAKHISFKIGIGTNFFMEIAKLRALRVLWQKVVKEFGGDKESQKTFVHAKTSKYYQTKLDPFVNTLRTTTEAFSAILGGADTITTTTYDDVLGKQSELSKRIARNTQIILKEESNLKRLIDPSGGSYYIESLTDKIIKKAWKEFQNIEKNGGMIDSLKSGYIQDKIEETVSLRKKDIYKRKSVIVGTNMFVNTEDEVPITINKIKQDSKTDYLKVKKLSLTRIAEPFEEMRKTVSEFSKKTGGKPKVFLANFGTVKQYKGRADFSRGYFEVGGFEIIYPDGFNDIEAMVSASIKSNAEIIVLCSDDKTYPEFVEQFSKSLKKQKPNISIVLAGFPGKDEERYREWGLDDFIFMGSNLFAILESLLKKIGVK